MTYNEILPLAEVKNYLRIDDDFTDDDEAIERMVRSALGFIEQRTNHIFQAQTAKEYFRNGSHYLDIYDYPFTYSGELTKLSYSNKVRFDADSVTVDTVGYATRADVPDALIDAALQIIESFYEDTGIPDSVNQIISQYRRFTIG